MKKVKALKPSANGAASYQPNATPWEQPAGWTQALKGRPIKAPSRQKTPVIVPHQGKSRHPIKLPMMPLNIQDPATGTPPINPPFAPSRLCAFALKPQQSRHIKVNRQLSERARPRAQQPPNLPAASPCQTPPASTPPRNPKPAIRNPIPQVIPAKSK